MVTYSVKELRPILKKCEKTIRKYITDKKLKAIYLGNKYVVTEDSLNQFIKENETIVD